MSRLPPALARLADRHPRHVVGRLAQITRARMERVGIGDSHRSAAGEHLLRAVRAAGVDDADELFEGFRRRVSTSSLPVFRDPLRTRSVVSDRWPDGAAAIRNRAERVAAGSFDLLGYRGLDFGDPIDWHLDPTRGMRAPRLHWSRVPYLDPDRVGDHKVVWELNRHQYFVTLGQAYWITADERWAALFVEHVESWLAANPPKVGMNWASSLEVAFRSISWLWALHFFAESERITAELFARMVAALRLHGRHIERYISTWFSPNTHLTGEALGLVYLGSMLPELPEAARWRERGRSWLTDALEFQIRPDGGYFEQSTHYHRYTTDFYVHLLILSRIGGRVPSGLDSKLMDVAEHLVAITRPDGHIPLLGDDDAGRLIFLDERPVTDVRATILSAAILLERADWAAMAGPASQEVVWLLGPDALDALRRMGRHPPPAEASRALPDTGFYVMRSGWEPDADYAVVRCGPHGALSGGHAHADALSIELVVGGDTLLVDPGTASYVDRDIRDHFRSSGAHNTVTVAGASSSEPGGPFGWTTRAASTAGEWVASPGFCYFEGWHDGFGRLEAGLRHERAVLWIREDYWVVRDLVTGFERRAPDAKATYQFAPGVEVRDTGEHTLETSTRDGRPLARMQVLRGSAWEASSGRVSPAYGDIRPAPARAVRGVPAGPGRLEILTLVSRAPCPVQELRAEGGRGWRIGERDLLIFGNAGDARIEAPDGVVETDFKCVWHRPGLQSRPGALLAVGGRRLELEPRRPLELAVAIRYLSMAEGREPEVVPTAAGSTPPSPHAISSWWHGAGEP